jgi:putative flippase GtrA
MNKMKNSRQLSIFFIRFLGSGGVNTAITYALYLTLIQFLSYKVSYTISFAAGIFLAYCLSRFFVFRVKAGLFAVTLFPLVYLVQYLLGLGVVTLWVDTLNWNQTLAPLASIALTVPITFFLSHLVFSQRSPPKK